MTERPWCSLHFKRFRLTRQCGAPSPGVRAVLQNTQCDESVTFTAVKRRTRVFRQYCAVCAWNEPRKCSPLYKVLKRNQAPRKLAREFERALRMAFPRLFPFRRAQARQQHSRDRRGDGRFDPELRALRPLRRRAHCVHCRLRVRLRRSPRTNSVFSPPSVSASPSVSA